FILTLLQTYHSSTLFPYTTLFRSLRANRSLNPLSLDPLAGAPLQVPGLHRRHVVSPAPDYEDRMPNLPRLVESVLLRAEHMMDQDRKSTRLNSSHVKISYAVFCLK